MTKVIVVGPPSFAAASTTLSGGQLRSYRVEPPITAATAVAKEIEVFCTASGNAKVALQDTQGSPLVPTDTLAANNTGTAVTSGYNTLSISDVAITSGTIYGLTIIGDASGVAVYDATTQTTYSVRYGAVTSSYASGVPDPMPSLSQAGNTVYKLRALGYEPPIITAVNTGSDISDGMTSVPVSGDNYEPTQYNGAKLELCNNAVYASATVKVEQTVTAWADDSLYFTVSQGGLSTGTVYAHITTGSGQVIAAGGFAVTLAAGGSTSVVDAYSVTSTAAVSNSGTSAVDGSSAAQTATIANAGANNVEGQSTTPMAAISNAGESNVFGQSEVSGFSLSSNGSSALNANALAGVAVIKSEGVSSIVGVSALGAALVSNSGASDIVAESVASVAAINSDVSGSVVSGSSAVSNASVRSAGTSSVSGDSSVVADIRSYSANELVGLSNLGSASILNAGASVLSADSAASAAINSNGASVVAGVSVPSNSTITSGYQNVLSAFSAGQNMTLESAGASTINGGSAPHTASINSGTLSTGAALRIYMDDISIQLIQDDGNMVLE